MGGSMIDDDWELASAYNQARTMVIVGHTGNGKSATGNSIIGRKVFKSSRSMKGVTSTCEMQRTVLNDGLILNVIDTPGLFDLSYEPEVSRRELVTCINMAKDGIHAVLIAISIGVRFSKEELAALQSLQDFFGSGINNYIIVVFTNGDVLEDEESLDDFLRDQSPDDLKEFLQLCEYRYVLFDNKTKDEQKKEHQLQQLLMLVDMVVSRNNGKPYSNELFIELKKGATILRDQTSENSLKGFSEEQISEMTEKMKISYDEHLSRINEMVDTKLKEAISRLEQQLAEEHAARLKAETNAQDAVQEAYKRSDQEIRKLREKLESAQRETEELRKCAENRGCNIL
ncbi:small GTPase [Lithospermum erythrorhizon]|uniref:Small GTPase n=1 Tax=Lithospermum erythrorhizon TaxID=34254 RepID=A0AAV3PGT8_LITER